MCSAPNSRIQASRKAHCLLSGMETNENSLELQLGPLNYDYGAISVLTMCQLGLDGVGQFHRDLKGSRIISPIPFPWARALSFMLEEKHSLSSETLRIRVN